MPVAPRSTSIFAPKSERMPEIVVGDTIRFSAVLLAEMVNDLPEMVLTRVKEIRTDPDGSKTLILERA